ncbi:hypothetical protein E2P86_18060 [Sphingobacterium psychroaquaticum]|uniref:hypothetical protein n=1 Tax=Sphingobacterium psychroaquaticum TaxID=561061 RepID=UPI00106C7826|nr:hypothetical protein [Sphingobacterium psychroaquaticum]QBQ42940.1 hypothetical protein E2P86_18060 [Sphingobacterium psychroaquaticum]
MNPKHLKFLKKRKIFFYSGLSALMLSGLNLSVQAQDSVSHVESHKRNYVKVEIFSVGASADISGSKNHPDRELMGTRQDIALSSSIRINHLFSNKIGWYAGLKLDYLDEKSSAFYDAIPVGEILLRVFYGGFVPAYTVDAGLLYRTETKRWDIHPRVGFGYGLFLMDRDSDKSKTLEDGSKQRNIYTQRASGSLLNVGISSHYFVSRKSFISLNATLQQPLEKSYGELSTTIDEQPTVNRRYESAGIGRNLTLSVGYGFTIGKRSL